MFKPRMNSVLSSLGISMFILLATSTFAADLFAPYQIYPTGVNPGIVATGDFNGDGYADIATGNSNLWAGNSNNVSVLYGNGDGTFKDKVDLALPPVTYCLKTIRVADFNNDGKSDIAVGYNHSTGIIMTVFLGNADGAFQEVSTYRVYDNIDSIETGDLNEDGLLDIIMVGSWYGKLTTFLGKGDGTFFQRTGSLYLVANRLVNVGDFNKDGKVDLALVGLSDMDMDGHSMQTLVIVNGNGDGGFWWAGAQYPAGSGNLDDQPDSITSGDLNGDGNIDLVLANSWTSTISIFIGNGDGTFQPKIEYFAGLAASGVIVSDINNDNLLDIVTTNSLNAAVSFLAGNGNGTFQDNSLILVGGNPVSIASGDFDRDGRPDLATANWENNTISILLSNNPPLPSAGPDQTIECAGPSGSSVTLSGSGSSDLDNDPLSYTWIWDGGSTTGVNPTMSLPLGTTVITLTVSDGKATATDIVNITVQDTTSPVTTATGGSDTWYNANVISAFSAIDSCSGVKEIHYTVNGSETVVPGSSASAIIATEGTNNITYFAIDNSGNIESPNSFTIKIDKTPPTGSVIINGDAATTTSTSVALTLSATDNLSGVSQMRFSSDGISWLTWEPYNTSKNWTLSNASDLMTVYVQFLDIAGNVSVSYSDTIYMDTDNDGFYDSLDNCPNVNNPLQEDRNGNGIGDACDGDIDGDTIVDIRDNCPTVSNLDQLDTDGDGAGDFCDACISDPQNNCLNSSSFISTDITQPVTISNFADTASVTIEPGDISTDTSITVTGETSTSNFAWGSNQQVLGAIYTFTADPSSNFSSTVTITLKYDQGTMPEGGRTEQNLDIYYYDTATLTWMPQNAIQDMVNNTLTLDTSHFLTYAVITTENPISDLIAAFRGVNIQDESTWENLMNQLTRAYDEYEGGDNEDVKDDLRTFINKLESGSREKIGQQDTDMLIQFANEIMARL